MVTDFTHIFGQTKKEYKPLEMFSAQTDELKKLIAAHPDYPIVVMTSNEVVGDNDYGWWYAPCLSFSIGELLDCEQDVNDEKVYTDRNELEEDLRDIMADMDEYVHLSDSDFEKALKNELAKYEPYWKNVIEIRADV